MHSVCDYNVKMFDENQISFLDIIQDQILDPGRQKACLILYILTLKKSKIAIEGKSIIWSAKPYQKYKNSGLEKI